MLQHTKCYMVMEIIRCAETWSSMPVSKTLDDDNLGQKEMRTNCHCLFENYLPMPLTDRQFAVTSRFCTAHWKALIQRSKLTQSHQLAPEECYSVPALVWKGQILTPSSVQCNLVKSRYRRPIFPPPPPPCLCGILGMWLKKPIRKGHFSRSGAFSVYSAGSSCFRPIGIQWVIVQF